MAKYMASLADQETLLAEEKKLRRLGRAMDPWRDATWKVISRSKRRMSSTIQAHGAATSQTKNMIRVYGPRLRRVPVEKYRLQ
jgi:hypothetical protein